MLAKLNVSTLPSVCASTFIVNDFSSTPFSDRAEAGRVLAGLCREAASDKNPLILALPRGGVPVAAEMSKLLHLPLDVFLVRKFSVVSQHERVAGIVASGGVRHLYDGTFWSAGLDSVLERETAWLERRESSYRRNRSPQQIAGRTVIVVDDGLTTGATMRNAVLALRHLAPSCIVAAVPVASPEVCADLAQHADSVICARMPHSFFSVRRSYTDFSPVLDSDIRNLLDSVDSAAFPRAFHA